MPVSRNKRQLIATAGIAYFTAMLVLVDVLVAMWLAPLAWNRLDSGRPASWIAPALAAAFIVWLNVALLRLIVILLRRRDS